MPRGSGARATRCCRTSARRTSVRITYAGTKSTDPKLRKSDVFAVRTFGPKGPGLLAQSIGRYTGTVVLPAGPVFIAVTAHGEWTMPRRQGLRAATAAGRYSPAAA